MATETNILSAWSILPMTLHDMSFPVNFIQTLHFLETDSLLYFLATAVLLITSSDNLKNEMSYLKEKHGLLHLW